MERVAAGAGALRGGVVDREPRLLEACRRSRSWPASGTARSSCRSRACTPNCSSVASLSETWSSRYIAYRRPEHPPGWTATRSAMSLRPSSTRSSFTLPAARLGQLDHRPPGPSVGSHCGASRNGATRVIPVTRQRRRRRQVPAKSATSAPGHREQVGGGEREHRIRRPGRRPRPRRRRAASRSTNARTRLGMAERRRAADREPGGGPGLLRRRAPDLGGARELGELGRVRRGSRPRSAPARLAVGARTRATSRSARRRTRSPRRRPRPSSCPPGTGGPRGSSAERPRRRQESLDRAAHVARAASRALDRQLLGQRLQHRAAASGDRRRSSPEPLHERPHRQRRPAVDARRGRTTHGGRTPAPAAAPRARRPTVLPGSDCSSSLPSPVMTRSARGQRSAKPDRLHHDLDARRSSRPEERHQPEAQASRRAGAGLVAQRRCPRSRSHDGREVAERAVQQQHVLGPRHPSAARTRRAAPRGPTSGLSTSLATTNGRPSPTRATSGREVDPRELDERAPPGPISPPAASRKRHTQRLRHARRRRRSSRSRRCTRSTRAAPVRERAARISSPVPRVVVRAGIAPRRRAPARARRPAPSPRRPTSPPAVGASPNAASTGSPSGPVDRTVRRLPAEAVDERVERPLSPVGHRHELDLVRRAGSGSHPVSTARGRLGGRQRAAELVGSDQDAHPARVQSAPTSTGILEGRRA